MHAIERALKRLDILFHTANAALAQLELPVHNEKNPEYCKYAQLYLIGMWNDWVKYHSLLTGKRNLIVGVFGCPSRGKSSFLNVLLGLDILPTDNFIGTTKAGTAISYQDSKSDEPFAITMIYEKNAEPEKKNRPVDSVKKQVEVFYKKSNLTDSCIDKIEIKGPIRSFIGNNITFVDTPGAVPNSNNDELDEEKNTILCDMDIYTERALSILPSVDVIIFCTKHGGTVSTDIELYNKKIIIKYDPINVITHSHNREDGQTNEAIIKKAQDKYDFMPDNTVVLDSKKALLIINDKKNKKRDIAKILNKKFKKDHDLEGFIKLREMVLKKINYKDPVVITERITGFEESYRSLAENAAENEIKLPKLPTLSEIKAEKKEIAINNFRDFFVGLFKISWKIIKWILIVGISIAIILVVLALIFG